MWSNKKKKNSVEILKIDDEFLHLKKCNFMKIDVELMEMEVLKGAKKFIKKNKPFLWIENHWNFPNKINKYLFQIGYNPYWSCTMFITQAITLLTKIYIQ